MRVYLVRHKVSGLFIPEAHGRKGRGGSHTEPSETLDGDCRIFRSERSAKLFLGQWALGKHVADRGYDAGHPGNDWAGEYYEEIRIVPQPQRNRDDMEIVPYDLVAV